MRAACRHCKCVHWSAGTAQKPGTGLRPRRHAFAAQIIEGRLAPRYPAIAPPRPAHPLWRSCMAVWRAAGAPGGHPEPCPPPHVKIRQQRWRLAAPPAHTAPAWGMGAWDRGWHTLHKRLLPSPSNLYLPCMEPGSAGQAGWEPGAGYSEVRDAPGDAHRPSDAPTLHDLTPLCSPTGNGHSRPPDTASTHQAIGPRNDAAGGSAPESPGARAACASSLAPTEQQF